MSTIRTCYRYEFEIQNDVKDNIADVDKSFSSNISVAEDTIDILHNINISRENGMLKLSITGYSFIEFIALLNKLIIVFHIIQSYIDTAK